MSQKKDDSLLKRPISRRQFIGGGAAGLAGMYVLGFRPIDAFAAPLPQDLPTTPQTLVVAWASGPNGCDHEFHNTLQSIGIFRNCGVAAIKHDPMAAGQVFQSDFSKLMPYGAKEWKMSSDWNAITVTLNQGVKSSAGNELTADDVVWTHQRHWGLQGVTWGFLKDAMLLSSVDAIKKEGPYTYTITASAPNALLEVIQAHQGAQIYDSVEFKKHATADDPWATKWAGSAFVGHGAWKLTEYTPGQSWTFERNENYYNPAELTGNVTKVVNRVIPSSANRVALLESGDIDMAFDLQSSELKSLEGKPGVRVDHLVGNHLQWLGFTFNSATSPALQDVNVRQAIAAALPYDLLLERPYLGLATQMKSTVAPAYAGYDVVSAIWADRKRDVAKAKELMAASKFPTGFTTTLHYDIGQPGQEESAIIIKAALAEIGITVDIVKVQTGDFFQLAFTAGKGFPGMFIYRDMAGTPDVNFGSHLWLKTGHCCAPGVYANKDVDALYAQAQTSPGDFKKRAELQKQIDDIVINKDPMGVPMQAVGFHAASRANAGGFWWQSLNEILWAKAWKK